MRNKIIGLFIPHIGCPQNCIFCDQKVISKTLTPVTSDDIILACEQGLNIDDDNSGGEIAFFGGSFTAIDREYMISLLKTAKQQVEKYGLRGIRISTRPDCVDDDVLCVLKNYGVTTVELGIQSSSDVVLQLNGRGHTFADSVAAAKLVKKHGFSFIAQMMVGMHGEAKGGAVTTAKEIIKLAPNGVRIYPVIVLSGTYLEQLYNDFQYHPLSVDEAVEICCELLLLFKARGIPVIKLGLHSDINAEKIVAGPFHPAFRQLCQAKLTLNRVIGLAGDRRIITINVPNKQLSNLLGHRRANIKKLSELGYTVSVNVIDDGAVLSVD